MKKFFGWVVGLLLVVIVMVLVARHFRQPPPPPAQVSVQARNISESVNAIGYIVPRHLITVRSVLSGTVQKLYHFAGEYVARGTPLVKIQPTPQPSAYAQAVSFVSQYHAAVEADQQHINNYKMLLAKKIITPNYGQLVTLKGQLAADQARLKNSQQNVALLEKGQAMINGQWQKGVVDSPVDGFILQRNVDQGDSVISLESAQAATTLFTIANMKDLIFKGTVDENDAHKLKLKMPASIQVGAIPDAKISGAIDRLSLQSDQENQKNDNYSAVASSSNADNPFNVGFKIEISQLNIPKNIHLLSGYSATAKMVLKQRNKVLSLPERVIHFKNEKPYVKVQGAGDKSRDVSVSLGISDGVYVEIIKGLSLNQKVLDVTPLTPTGH